MFELLVGESGSHLTAVPLPTPTRPVLVSIRPVSADDRLNSPSRALSYSELMNPQLKRKNNGHRWPEHPE